MYKITLTETIEWKSIKFNNSDFILFDNDLIHGYDGKQFRCLGEFEPYSIRSSDDGYSFIKDKMLEQKDIPYKLSINRVGDVSDILYEVEVTGDFREKLNDKILTSIGGDVETLYLTDLNTNKTKQFSIEHSGNIFPGFISNKLIYAFDKKRCRIIQNGSTVKKIERTYYSFDYELNERFSIKLDDNYEHQKRPISLNRELPIHTENIVVFNLGLNKVDKSHAKLQGYYLESGELAWEYEMSSELDFIHADNNKLYIVENGHAIVLDAQTGNELLNKQIARDNAKEFSLYPIGNSLYFGERVRTPENLIGTYFVSFLDPATGDIIQRIDIPEPYGLGSLIASDSISDSVLYLSAGKAVFGVSGFAKVEFDPDISNCDDCFTVTPRLHMDVKREIENRESYYIISTEHDDLDEILFYGSMYINEIIDDTRTLSDNRDKQHRGKFFFDIDFSKFDTKDAKKRVEKRLERLKENIIAAEPGAGSRFKYSFAVRDTS